MSDVCPKCCRPAGAAEAACPRCGLLRTRWADFDAQPVRHPVLDPLWEQAEANWEDEGRHQALVAAVTADWTALSALSQRYGAVLRRNPEDAMARAAMDQLIQIALLLPGPRRDPGPTRAARLLRALLVAMLFAALLGMLLSLGRKLG
ncbi:MAG: hypothetical protein RMK29_15895 [Myxococcales bacterium]|nr:hypothetical protein [Myxococcales bacterium]